MISIVITTHGHDTLRTRRCLDAILAWKRPEHELIVVAHDESVLLGVYLRFLRDCGRIDRLLFAEPGHGHVRGVNLGFDAAKGSLLCNINTDVLVGGDVIDHIKYMFAVQKRLGMVGWHYNWAPAHTGTFWDGGRLRHTIRVRENLARRPGYVDAQHMRNLRDAHWSSGRVIGAVGDRRILCANTSFFVIRAGLWRAIGGFDEVRYPHIWADDFLCYAVLDQNMDIANLPEDVRVSQRPAQFNSLSDLEWEGRHDPHKFIDRISTIPATGKPGSWRQQIHALVENHARLGARITLAGDPHLVPRSLSRHCVRGGRSPDDTDYLLVGGPAPLNAQEQIRPGGVLMQFSESGTKALSTPAVRLRYRKSPACPCFIHSSQASRCS